MEQQFVVLHKSNPIAWALMPHALERIKRFAVKYETDTKPEELAVIIQQHFISDKPLLLVIVAYKPGEGVFAHALACIDDITGLRFLTIMQLETDIPFEDRNGVNRMWDQFKVWGLENGAKEARIVTMDDNVHVRMFQRYHGFKKHRISMRKSLLED
jgi:hypothetical protein